MIAARLSPWSARRIRIDVRALLAAVLLAACAAEPELKGPTVDEPARRLNGEWRWVTSLDVNTLQVHTPATAGFDATLSFTAATTHSGTFTYSRAGADPVHGEFTISHEDAPGNDFIFIQPHIDFLARNAWVNAASDTLRLGGVMEGGYNTKYVRVRP